MVSTATPVPTQPQLSTQWILDEIQREGIKDIESLLARFDPKSLRKNLLVYGSESRQFASFLSPRVIVYGSRAEFIMAFNGEPGSRGYDELEILRFDHEQNRFRPELISFDPKGIASPQFDSHPTVCASCHQKDIRPNWDPYFHWVGVYGSEDDNTNAGTFQNGDLVTSGPEHDHFAQFLEKRTSQIAKKKGRYRFLPRHPSRRPNLEFNDMVTCLNMKRMLRALADHPLATRIWPAIHRWQISFDKIPSDLMARARRSYSEVRAETLQVMRDAIAARVARHRKLVGEPIGRVRDLATESQGNPIYEIKAVTDWRFLFEEILHKPFARAGGITSISVVDSEVTNYWLFARTCTIVYGN